MSGTSLDGVDAALVSIEGRRTVELVAFHTEAFDAQERTAILQAIDHGSARSLALLDVELGERFAATTLNLLKEAGASPTEVSLVASHGQTVWHEPRRASLQLGDPAVIAERVGVRVVSDFRSRDVAAGGEGAPLVPIADAHLFGHPARGRALLNLGGMANVTWVPRRGVVDGVIAFDTGPGVAVIDAVVGRFQPGARFDRDGARALRGDAVTAVVDTLLEHEYFDRAPPKSTGRETFGDRLAANLIGRVRSNRANATDDDCVATAVSLTARSIARALKRWLPAEVERDLVVSGGGTRNPALLKLLNSELQDWSILPFEQEFFSGDAKEAVAFAYLGWLTVLGETGNVPSATGAKGPRILGRLTPA